MFKISVVAPESEIIDVRVFDEEGNDGPVGFVSLLGLAHNENVTICYDGDISTWSDVEAKLICNFLGYGDGTAEDLGYNAQMDVQWSVSDFQCDRG